MFIILITYPFYMHQCLLHLAPHDNPVRKHQFELIDYYLSKYWITEHQAIAIGMKMADDLDFNPFKHPVILRMIITGMKSHDAKINEFKNEFYDKIMFETLWRL